MKSLISSLLEIAHWLVLAAWFGGIAVFSFLVAPAAFRVLPSQQLAGDLVGAVLSKLYITGTFAGVILLLTANGLRSRGLMAGRRNAGLIASLVVALAANVYAQWSIAPRVAELRKQLAAESAVPVGDPRKAEFDRMHQRSVQLMAANLLALVAAIAISRRTPHPTSAAAQPSSTAAS